MPYGHCSNIDYSEENQKIICYDLVSGWNNNIEIEDVYQKAVTFNVFIYKAK
jgi:hypothetical protein